MTSDEVADLLEDLRSARSELTEVEVKLAERGLPKSVRETLSSFSNTRGGVLVLGVSESEGFSTVGVYDPKKAQDDLASMCSEMEPSLRPSLQIHTIDGANLVVAEIPELPIGEKPCFYRGAGMTNGSYVRVGDGDRRLSSYEVQMMLSSRGQPREDLAPVPDASISDLDPDLVRVYLERLRVRIPRFRDCTDSEVLQMTRVVVSHEDDLVPSLGGLLALGDHPQQYFPNLNITFVSYPTIRAGDLGPGRERFLDERAMIGSVPAILTEVMQTLRRNMSKAAVSEGSFDRWDYPEDALRECIVNALVHRDLGPSSHGTAIQIEMYPDRLTVRNPGGLYGPVAEDQLGEEGISSTRNQTLVAILEDTPAPDTGNPICQNRGTGLGRMLSSLREAHMRPPRFDNKISRFQVTFPGHSLMDRSKLDWLAQFSGMSLTENQKVALALMRDGESLNNTMYRQATGADSRVATNELRDLVQRGLARQHNTRRWATYELADGYLSDKRDPQQAPSPSEDNSETDIISADVSPPRLTKKQEEVYLLIKEAGSLRRRDIEKRLRISKVAAYRRLKALIEKGEIEPVGEPRSPDTHYRVASSART